MKSNFNSKYLVTINEIASFRAWRVDFDGKIRRAVDASSMFTQLRHREYVLVVGESVCVPTSSSIPSTVTRQVKLGGVATSQMRTCEFENKKNL
jgi:hypothetical protein